MRPQRLDVSLALAVHGRGRSWQGPVPLAALPDPVNKAGVTAWPAHSPSALVMSHTPSTRARVNLTLSVSPDAGATWSAAARVSPVGGYSDVQVLPSGAAAVLFERGGSDARHHQGCGGIDIAFVALLSPA